MPLPPWKHRNPPESLALFLAQHVHDAYARASSPDVERRLAHAAGPLMRKAQRATSPGKLIRFVRVYAQFCRIRLGGLD